MMRAMLLALLGMALMLPGPAEASADRRGQYAQQRGAAPHPRGLHPTIRRNTTPRPRATHQRLTLGPNQAIARSCTARRNCIAAAPRQTSWQAGLTPAAGTQAQTCPEGTMATLARGHDDVIRCMPL